MMFDTMRKHRSASVAFDELSRVFIHTYTNKVQIACKTKK